MKSVTIRAGSGALSTNPSSRHQPASDWKDQAKRRAIRFRERYEKRIAGIEADLAADDGAGYAAFGSNGRRMIKATFGNHVGSWHYFTVSLTWAAFLLFMRESREGERKGGSPIYVAGILKDTIAGEQLRRMKSNVVAFDVLGIDLDKSDASRDDINAKLDQLGIEASDFASWSNGISRTRLAWESSTDGNVTPSAFRTFCKDRHGVVAPRAVTGEMAKAYLVEIDQIDADALGEVTIVDAAVTNTETIDGAEIVEREIAVGHDPLTKTRIFILLDKRVDRQPGESDGAFQVRWDRDYYFPTARMLGYKFDASCSTIERAWYCKAHYPGREFFEPRHYEGATLAPLNDQRVRAHRRDDQESKAPKPSKTSKSKGADKPIKATTERRTDWHGFLAADAAVALLGDAIDKRETDNPGVAVDCPFRQNHGKSKQGKHQLYVRNADAANRVPHAKCQSETCQAHGYKWEDYLGALFGEHELADAFWLKAADARPEVKSGSAVYRFASEIDPEEVTWLVKDHLALSTVVLLSGDTGVAKSQMTLHWAACVTTGKPFAEGVTVGADAMGKCVVITGEDSIDKVVRPRLEAAGADLAKVIVLEGYKVEVSKTKEVIAPFSLDVAVEIIADILDREDGVKLVIVDPVNAFLGGEINAYMNNEVRAILMPLVKLAEDRGIVLVLVHHNAKDKKGKSLTGMVGGSNAWVETARSVWMCVAENPDRPEDASCVIEQIKSNNGLKGQRYKYTVQGHIIEHGGKTIETAHVIVQGEAEKSVAQLARGDDKQSSIDNASEFLRRLLANGAVEAREAQHAAVQEGITQCTLKRAKKAVGVISVKVGKGTWKWALDVPQENNVLAFRPKGAGESHMT